MLREEVDERGYGVKTKGVVREIDGVEFGEREKGCYEVGEGGWDL